MSSEQRTARLELLEKVTQRTGLTGRAIYPHLLEFYDLRRIDELTKAIKTKYYNSDFSAVQLAQLRVLKLLLNEEIFPY